MTKQLTRQEVEGLIEVLADKTLSFGCRIFYGGFSNYIAISNEQQIGHAIVGTRMELSDIQEYKREILGHPIYIGTVLEKIQGQGEEKLSVGAMEFDILELVNLWEPLELSRSLQEICEASGWGNLNLLSDSPQYREVLKSPEANALFSFLQEIL